MSGVALQRQALIDEPCQSGKGIVGLIAGRRWRRGRIAVRTMIAFSHKVRSRRSCRAKFQKPSTLKWTAPKSGAEQLRHKCGEWVQGARNSPAQSNEVKAIWRGTWYAVAAPA